MCLHLMVFVLVLNAISVRQFLITSKHQVLMMKSSIVLSILYMMQ